MGVNGWWGSRGGEGQGVMGVRGWWRSRRWVKGVVGSRGGGSRGGGGLGVGVKG